MPEGLQELYIQKYGTKNINIVYNKNIRKIRDSYSRNIDYSVFANLETLFINDNLSSIFDKLPKNLKHLFLNYVDRNLDLLPTSLILLEVLGVFW